MNMNNTPSGERIHIGIFGKRNAGKSSIINALTGQSLAIVSDIKGTTTDPVLKAMELLPLGPVVMIDTPGLDDEGSLGALRIQKAYQILNKTDIAVLVVDGTVGMTGEDDAILKRIQDKAIPCVIVMNKADLANPRNQADSASVSGNTRYPASGSDGIQYPAHDSDRVKNPIHNSGGTQYPTHDSYRVKYPAHGSSGAKDPIHDSDGTQYPASDSDSAKQAPAVPVLWVSAASHSNIQELKEQIASLAPAEDTSLPIVGDLLHPSDLVVLVIPIDKAAPKGRLILPQQQTIRDILEVGAVSVVTRNTELKETLASLGRKPALVITDSQAFEQAAADVPEDIPLTSFSILFARYKGDLKHVVAGARALDRLKDGDHVLISEGCTHHRQCGDIGTEKLPAWIRKYTGKTPEFEFTSGTEFPLDLSKYRLIIHCGGCMLNEREMKYRLKCAEDAGVPMTNYGTAIAYMKGILERSIAMF